MGGKGFIRFSGFSLNSVILTLAPVKGTNSVGNSCSPGMLLGRQQRLYPPIKQGEPARATDARPLFGGRWFPLATTGIAASLSVMPPHIPRSLCLSVERGRDKPNRFNVGFMTRLSHRF